MLIDKDNILIDPAASSTPELFELFYKNLFEKGFVKKGFYRALIEREKSFPTGLDTGNIKIAIPHTDSDMIIREGIAIAVLRNPILFGEMSAPDNSLRVNIVFLLLIKDSRAEFYRNLLNKIKNSDILHKICESNNSQVLCLLLIKSLNT